MISDYIDLIFNDQHIIAVIFLIVLIFSLYIKIKRKILKKKLSIRAEKAVRKIRMHRLAMDHNRNSYHWENDH
jgi:hypothetical protein